MFSFFAGWIVILSLLGKHGHGDLDGARRLSLGIGGGAGY